MRSKRKPISDMWTQLTEMRAGGIVYPCLDAVALNPDMFQPGDKVRVSIELLRRPSKRKLPHSGKGG